MGNSTLKMDGSSHPFRRAVLRGLAVVLPPLLTIVIFLWVGNTVTVYVLEPLEDAARDALVWRFADVRDLDELDLDPKDSNFAKAGDGALFRRVVDGEFVPNDVYEDVKNQRASQPMPSSALGVYERYVEIKYLKRYIVVPVFLWLFIVFLYLLGKFLAAGVGKFFWGIFERGIHRLPLVRNVYSSVKQVTDFMFSEQDIEYTRVIAIEYPRKGIWSLGLVTGESMVDIRSAANEPVLSVLVPTSPMPVTGFTVTVKKSEAVDLNITIDQAFQFIVSCGVVVPPTQLEEALHKASLESGDGKSAGSTTAKALPSPAAQSES